jgi:membrane protein DedA with SNARE-associated domain
MLEGLTQWLLESIRTHGILAVILGVAIETIVVPIPSPLILMAAGSVLITSDVWYIALLNGLWISVVAALAQTVGSFFVYGIAYSGGKPLIERFERWHGVSWKEILEFEKKFKGKNQNFIMFLLRAIPVMPLSIVSGVAGVIKMRWQEFSVFTFLGAVPRNLIFAMLGWYLREVYIVFAAKLDHIETIITVFLVLAIIGYIIGHKLGWFWKIRKKILG